MSFSSSEFVSQIHDWIYPAGERVLLRERDNQKEGGIKRYALQQRREEGVLVTYSTV